MALYGTHIRFALDVKKDFNIKKIEEYISGTVYPDSRYISKIDRHLTHSDFCLTKNFYHNSDFKLGWFIHVLYDKIQFDTFDIFFSELFNRTDIKYGNDHWTTRTVLKILQDLDDLKHFDIIPFLPSLSHIETPNGESPKTIETYNTYLTDIYKKSPVIVIDDILAMWRQSGMSEEIVQSIREKFFILSGNKEIMEKISLVYKKTLALYPQYQKELEQQG